MKMTWSDEGDLQFGVYLKPGQELLTLKQSPKKALVGWQVWPC
jgi:hypothetical protein